MYKLQNKLSQKFRDSHSIHDKCDKQRIVNLVGCMDWETKPHTGLTEKITKPNNLYKKKQLLYLYKCFLDTV